MKILFVSDYLLSENSGGAQQSNAAMIAEGISRGHCIVEFAASTKPSVLHCDYDLIISSNLEMMNFIYGDYILDRIINGSETHVRLEHDSCLYLQDDDREKLFRSSALNFFLSNFHLNRFKSMYGDYFGETAIVPDPISRKKFRKMNVPKKVPFVYCGFLHKLKGVHNLIAFAERNREHKISVYGWGEQSIVNELKSIPNIIFHDPVPNSATAYIYASAHYVFHAPLVDEPFCRMVGEALLCGCGVVGATDRIGAHIEYANLGYDKFAESCDNAHKNFWEKVEKIA